MRQEQSAVEVLDLAEQRAGFRRPLVCRLGETLEEERAQEAAVVAILSTGPAFGELVLQIVPVAVVDEVLLLQEVNEHQPVQQYRRIPAAVAFVVDALDKL